MKGAAKMYVKLTISERLKDLRVERHLTLEHLADATGLSKSALGKYETEDFKDISPFAITTLADFYGVSTDYLLGLSENKNPANAELQALHLQDDAIDSLRNGKYNKRLLSELVAHEKFQQFMIDMEIYVDRIADSRVDDMNAMLEIVRKQAMRQHGAEVDDLYMRTLELGQVKTEDYFARILSDDLTKILNDIRQAHKRDITTADEISAAQEVSRHLQDAAHYEGSLHEKQARVYLASLGIDYEAITKEEFATLIGILSKSKKLQIRQGSQRGKRKRQK
jgi:transcriptional regulator with XRE-family HTH domain